MSEIVDMHEAKTTLSRLVERARAGEEIIIAEAGEPLVQLVPIERPTAPRVPGRWCGAIWIADDFERLPNDVLDAFEGNASYSKLKLPLQAALHGWRCVLRLRSG